MKSDPNHTSPSGAFVENSLFWITLIFLSMGAITTFYYQGNMVMKTMSNRIYKELPASPDTRQENVLTLYDPDTGTPLSVIMLDGAGAVKERGGK